MCLVLCLLGSLVLRAKTPAGLGELHISATPDGHLTVDATVGRRVTSVQLELADAQDRRLLLRGGLQPQKGRVHFEERLSFPVQPWSAENPVTYMLKVWVFSPGGLQELRFFPFAFRTVEQRRGRWVVNATAVQPKGLRHTDLLPEGDCSEGDLLYAIRQLKQLNINAVCEDYRSGDAQWSTLCDRFGLYRVPAQLLDSCAAAPQALRYRFRDIRTAGTPWVLEVTNGYFFRDLADVRLCWSLESDGEPVKTGEVEWLNAGPQETVQLNLGVSPQQLEGLPGTLTLTVRYVLKRDRSLLQAGTELCAQQLLLRDNRPVLMDCEGAAIGQAQQPGRTVFSGPSWSVAFDPSTGGLCSLVRDGREWLAEPLLPDLPEARPRRFNVVTLDQACLVEVSWPDAAVSYRIAADGSVSGVANAPLRLALPAACNRVDFLGLGPEETLPDSTEGALLGRYRQAAGEAGVHSGLRFYRLLDAAGAGLEVSSPLDFTAAVRPYTPDGRLLTSLRLSAPADAPFFFVIKTTDPSSPSAPQDDKR